MMSLFLLIIGPILTVIIGSWVQTYLFQSSKRELESYQEFNKTTYPKRLFTFFFVGSVLVSILFIAFGIVFYVTTGFDQSTQWITYFISGIFVTAIPLVGFINIITSYELIEEDKIIVKRWFKSRDVHLKDIEKYSYSFNQLTVYDLEDKPVLFVGDNRLGMKNLITYLEKNGKYRK